MFTVIHLIKRNNYAVSLIHQKECTSTRLRYHKLKKLSIGVGLSKSLKTSQEWRLSNSPDLLVITMSFCQYHQFYHRVGPFSEGTAPEYDQIKHKHQICSFQWNSKLETKITCILINNKPRGLCVMPCLYWGSGGHHVNVTISTRVI